MLKKKSQPRLYAGIDHLSLDTRIFNPTPTDIEHICQFFGLGRLKKFENEKGVVISHSNFFVYAETTQGQYALKFYPADATKMIVMEYAINRLLIGQAFATPAMYTGQNSKPFFTCQNRLATCFSYIEGLQAWQLIKKRNTVLQLNTVMLNLKKILSKSKDRIVLNQQESLTKQIHAAAQSSRAAIDYDQKELIETYLRDMYRAYQEYQPLFKRQWLHNNSTLTNFIIQEKTIYTLDLSHIREDYILSDLAALVISCLFLEISPNVIKPIIETYFKLHKIKPDCVFVLATLIQTGLIKEFLKNINREKNIHGFTHQADVKATYLYHLKARNKLITKFLMKLKDPNSFWHIF